MNYFAFNCLIKITPIQFRWRAQIKTTQRRGTGARKREEGKEEEERKERKEGETEKGTTLQLQPES